MIEVYWNDYTFSMDADWLFDDDDYINIEVYLGDEEISSLLSADILANLIDQYNAKYVKPNIEEVRGCNEYHARKDMGHD